MRLFFVLALFFPLTSSYCATYYVDFVSGSNSNAGTSITTPWKHAPGDPQATGTPSTKVLVAGDVVRFKGGVVYYGEIVLSKSGTPTQPIIFEGGNLTGWGATRAVIDLQYQASTAIFFNSGVSYVTIRAFEIRNVGGYADNDPVLLTTCATDPITSPPGGTGISLSSGENVGISLDNLYLHRIGNWRNTEPFSGTNSITGMGISLENAQNVKISNVEFTKMRIPISIKATETIDTVDVSRVHIHDYVVWGVDVAPRRDGATIKNITIRDSIIRDYHQFDKGNWTGCGEKPHTDGIFLRTASMASTWQNIKIYNNEFYADYPELSEGGTASIYVSQGPSVDIFNNTFRGDRHSRSIGVGHTNPSTIQQVVRIYNNSFYHSAMPIILSGEDDPALRKVYIQNNLFYRGGNPTSVMMYRDTGVSPVVLNHNIYWDPTLSADEKYVIADGGYKKFAQVQEMGFEQNGYYKDPLFVSVEKQPKSANDLRLQSTSPARGKGANLSSYFSFDKLNNPRPSTGAWDIGAFTYQPGRPGDSPLSPGNLKVVR